MIADQWWVVEFPDSRTLLVVRAPTAVEALTKATATTSPRSMSVRFAIALEDYTKERSA